MTEEPSYALVWPRALFQWEGKRVLELVKEKEFLNICEHLLREAFHGDEVFEHFSTLFPQQFGTPPSASTDAYAFLSQLLKDDTRLRPYQAPVYWAERTRSSWDLTDGIGSSFAVDFRQLILDLRDTGYFPKVLPTPCYDEEDVDTADLIQRATKLQIEWPIGKDQVEALDDAALYSLVEFFHDNASRPRSTWFHHYSDCGLHYRDNSVESGQVIYRWKVNSLLEAHTVPLRLGAVGEERGRLIRQFSSPLNRLATQQIQQRAELPRDEVAHAIRMFRRNQASVAEKRAAIALLFGELEPKRKKIEKKLSASDASDLFRIANKFSIRHRGKDQDDSYGEEYLDWMFWVVVSTIELMDALDK